MSSQADPTTSQRLFQLGLLVLKRSKENRIEWKETGPAAYYTKVGDYIFQVESVDRDGNHPFKIQIETPGFNETEILTSLSTSEEPFVTPPRDDWQITIELLYEEARRRGSSIEKALDTMLTDLERDAPAADKPTDDDIPF
jgi:hypothetical protein